jgi:hypothetical protein
MICAATTIIAEEVVGDSPLFRLLCSIMYSPYIWLPRFSYFLQFFALLHPFVVFPLVLLGFLFWQSSLLAPKIAWVVYSSHSFAVHGATTSILLSFTFCDKLQWPKRQKKQHKQVKLSNVNMVAQIHHHDTLLWIVEEEPTHWCADLAQLTRLYKNWWLAAPCNPQMVNQQKKLATKSTTQQSTTKWSGFSTGCSRGNCGAEPTLLRPF